MQSELVQSQSPETPVHNGVGHQANPLKGTVLNFPGSAARRDGLPGKLVHELIMISRLSFSCKYIWSIPISLAVFFLTLDCPVHADDTCQILNQSSDYFGKFTAFIGPKGLRVESKQLSFVMLAQAPNWTVTSFRSSDRKFLISPLPEWKQRLTFASGKDKKEKQYIAKRGKTGSIAGLKAVQYILATARNWKPGPDYLAHHSECWVTTDLKAPKEAVDILSSAAGLPPTAGVPLRIMRHVRGKTYKSLDTTATSTGKLTTAMLTLPKGYTRVKDEMTFLMGADTDLGALLEGSGN